MCAWLCLKSFLNLRIIACLYFMQDYEHIYDLFIKNYLHIISSGGEVVHSYVKSDQQSNFTKTTIIPCVKL